MENTNRQLRRRRPPQRNQSESKKSNGSNSQQDSGNRISCMYHYYYFTSVIKCSIFLLGSDSDSSDSGSEVVMRRQLRSSNRVRKPRDSFIASNSCQGSKTHIKII